MSVDRSAGIGMKILAGAVLLTMSVSLYLVFLFAPTQNTMGHIQRIFYFHVPSAWVSFLAFFVVFVASIMYLVKRDRKYDLVAAASAEIGVVFATLVLITGPIWARPVWNVWWEWSPRLTLFLVLWFIYIAYLMLRNFVEGEERSARLAAVFGIVGFVDVPIVYLSIRLWRDIHPSPVIAGGENSGLHPDMWIAFMSSLLAFTLLYFYLLVLASRLRRSGAVLADMKRQVSY
jgi:heme exporter protein C